MHDVGSVLDKMIANDSNIKITATDLTIHRRSNSFAQGTRRAAAYARTDAPTNKLVIKSPKAKCSSKTLAQFTEDMRCQALYKAFALELNALSEGHHSLDFLTMACLVRHSTSDKGNYIMAMEPSFPGTYIKYNSNSGWVNNVDNPFNPFNRAAQAFSHFTFERSRGRLLVSDLQGVGCILTDPAIHTRDTDRFPLTPTNLGQDGFKFFFATHKCNAVCRKLGLLTHGGMLVPGGKKLNGRSSWPTLSAAMSSMRVYCSNKLCSRIVLLSSARKSPNLSGYHWCDLCWDQLFRSQVSLLCVAEAGAAEGPHEFVVSRFFYESQGTIVPKTCPRHRPRTDTTRHSGRR